MRGSKKHNSLKANSLTTTATLHASTNATTDTNTEGNTSNNGTNKDTTTLKDEQNSALQNTESSTNVGDDTGDDIGVKKNAAVDSLGGGGDVKEGSGEGVVASGTNIFVYIFVWNVLWHWIL